MGKKYTFKYQGDTHLILTRKDGKDFCMYGFLGMSFFFLAMGLAGVYENHDIDRANAAARHPDPPALVRLRVACSAYSGPDTQQCWWRQCVVACVHLWWGVRWGVLVVANVCPTCSWR